MHSTHIRPQSPDRPPESKRTSRVSALSRRISAPPPYTLTEPHVAQPSVDTGATMPVNAQFHHVHHQYNLKSRGRDYALITVASHAADIQGYPLLYFGEELKGFVALSLNDLNDMLSIDVVVSWFPK